MHTIREITRLVTMLAGLIAPRLRLGFVSASISCEHCRSSRNNPHCAPRHVRYYLITIMDSSITTSTSTSTHGLKRKSRRERWEGNKRKTRRDRGKGYVAANVIVVPRKKFKEIPHCCRGDCYSKIPTGLQKELFNNFYSMGSKEK